MNSRKSKRNLSAQEWQLYSLFQNYDISDKNLNLTVKQWREKKLKEFRERGAL
jgi:hypothetical protein